MITQRADIPRSLPGEQTLSMWGMEVKLCVVEQDGRDVQVSPQKYTTPPCNCGQAEQERHLHAKGFLPRCGCFLEGGTIKIVKKIRNESSDIHIVVCYLQDSCLRRSLVDLAVLPS